MAGLLPGVVAVGGVAVPHGSHLCGCAVLWLDRQAFEDGRVLDWYWREMVGGWWYRHFGELPLYLDCRPAYRRA